MTPTLCACASSEQGRGHLPHWDSVGRGRHRALRSRGRGRPHTVGAACGGRPARRLVCRLLSTPLCSPACPGVLDQRPLLLAAQGSTVTRRTAGPRGSPDQSSPGHQQQPDPKGGPQYLRQPHFTSSPRVPTGLTSQLNARQRGLCFPSSQPHCGSNDQSSPDRQPQGQRAVSTASELPSPSSCKSTTHISAKDLGIALVVAAPDRSLEQCRPLCPALALPSSGLEAGGAHKSPQLIIQRDASLGAGVWNRASPWALRSPASCSPRDRREAETPHVTPASSRGAHAPAWAAGTGPCPRQWGDSAPEGRAQGRPQLLSSSPSPGDSTGPRPRRPEPAH